MMHHNCQLHVKEVLVLHARTLPPWTECPRWWSSDAYLRAPVPVQAHLPPPMCLRTETRLPTHLVPPVQGKQTPQTVADTVARLPNLPPRQLDVHLVDVVLRLPLIDPHSAEIALDLVAGPVYLLRTEETGACKVPEVRPVAAPRPGSAAVVRLFSLVEC